MTDLDQAPERVRVHFDAPFALVADVTPAAAAELALEPGAEVWCAVKATAIQSSRATRRLDRAESITSAP